MEKRKIQSRSKTKQRRKNDEPRRIFWIKKLNKYFLSTVEIPRIRVVKRQEIETLINEEAMLLAKYLRNEKSGWVS